MAQIERHVVFYNGADATAGDVPPAAANSRVVREAIQDRAERLRIPVWLVDGIPSVHSTAPTLVAATLNAIAADPSRRERMGYWFGDVESSFHCNAATIYRVVDRASGRTSPWVPTLTQAKSLRRDFAAGRQQVPAGGASADAAPDGAPGRMAA